MGTNLRYGFRWQSPISYCLTSVVVSILDNALIFVLMVLHFHYRTQDIVNNVYTPTPTSALTNPPPPCHHHCCSRHRCLQLNVFTTVVVTVIITLLSSTQYFWICPKFWQHLPSHGDEGALSSAVTAAYTDNGEDVLSLVVATEPMVAILHPKEGNWNMPCIDLVTSWSLYDPTQMYVCPLLYDRNTTCPPIILLSIDRINCGTTSVFHDTLSCSHQPKIVTLLLVPSWDVWSPMYNQTP